MDSTEESEEKVMKDTLIIVLNMFLFKSKAVLILSETNPILYHKHCAECRTPHNVDKCLKEGP